MKPLFRPMVTVFLESCVLRSDMLVFEWGMGGSTTWLADRVKHVTSVEHDPEWFSRVPKKKNLKCMLIPPEDGVVRADPAVPGAYFSDDKHWSRHNFRRYASAIDDLGPFDLIFVDGRVRPSCLMHGHSRLKVGGFLMLDDTNRAYYLQHTAYLFDGWDRFAFLEKKTETIIWRKAR